MEMITAKDFLKENANEITYEEGEMFAADVTPYMLIEFAKIHVKAALEAAVEKGTATLHCRDYYDEHIVIDENSILTAYPENLIK